MKLQSPNPEDSEETGLAPPPSVARGSCRKRIFAVSVAVFSLFLSAAWEPIFFHRHEQILQLIGIALIGAWAWISSNSNDTERRFVEKIVFALFLAMVCMMALRPDLLHAEARLLTSYRGMPRWKGWTIDPNNTGIILGLASVVALRLKREFPKRFSRLFLALAALCALQLARSFSRIGMLVTLLALLAHVIVGKYCDHLPLYRQEQIFAQRYKINLPRQTLSRWMELAADWLKPIYQAIRTGVICSS